MTTIWQFMVAHETASVLVAYYVTSAAISSLPAPWAESSGFYKWFFQFSNTVAGNLSRAFSSKLGVPQNPPPAP